MYDLYVYKFSSTTLCSNGNSENIRKSQWNWENTTENAKVHSCHEKKRKKQCELVSCETQYICMNYSLCINILQLHWGYRNRVHSEVHCCVHHQAKLQLLFQYPCFELDGNQQQRIWIRCVLHITGALVWLQHQNQKTCQFSFYLKAREQTVSLPLLQWRKSAASVIFNERRSKQKNDSDWGICKTFAICQ